MNPILEMLLVALLAIGSFFVLVGSFGLVKLSDFFKRLHGPTKASTLGVGSVLVAAMLHRYLVLDEVGVRELLITVFVFMTAPVSAHMLAKAAMATQPGLRPPPPESNPRRAGLPHRERDESPE